jgi:hypothetical protein
VDGGLVAESRTEKGRTERQQDGEHRSPPVTPGQQRSLENGPSPGATAAEQARCRQADEGSIPPSSTLYATYQGFLRRMDGGTLPPSATPGRLLTMGTRPCSGMPSQPIELPRFRFAGSGRNPDGSERELRQRLLSQSDSSAQVSRLAELERLSTIRITGSSGTPSQRGGSGIVGRLAGADAPT